VRRRREVLLALFFFVVPAALLETAARLFLPPPPPNAVAGLKANEIEDEVLLWRHRAGHPEGPINSLGFRGPEIALEKAPGTFRILSLGESTAYGEYVTLEDTYAWRIESALRARGLAVEVLNGGVRAWSTVQSARFLAREIDRLRPDLVLVYHEINDFLPSTYRGLRLPGGGLTDRDLMRRSWLVRLARRSRLVSALRLALVRAGASATLKERAAGAGQDILLADLLPYAALPAGETSGEAPWMDNPNRLVRVPDADRATSLAEIVELTRSRGIRLILIHPAYPESRRHRCVLTRIAAEGRVPLLEVEEALDEAGRRDRHPKGDYFLDHFHPRPRGHAVIAHALLPLVRQEIAAARLPP
jgi:lysophospholipase L1-like esterase